MEKIVIRREETKDNRQVEELTREAFWNVHAPGCDEHYLVHIMRAHEDFIAALDFVAELDGQIVANVMYTKSRLKDDAGHEKTILTFGPVSVLPAYQRRGIGKALLEHSFAEAVKLGYGAIVIFGSPANYIPRGFKSSRKYNVCVGDDAFPTAMLAKELKPGFFDGTKWHYLESPLFEVDPAAAEAFDQSFEPKEERYELSQEEFYIYSRSSVR